jgi:hypothetical protein
MRSLTIILLFIWTVQSVVGQEREEILLLQETVWIKTLRKSNQIHIEFEKGDSAVFDIKVAKGRRIKKYSIYDSKDKLIKEAKKKSRLSGLQAEFLDIKESGEYYIVFKNRGLFPREVELTIKRFPEPLRDTSFWEEKLLEEELVEIGSSDKVSLDTLTSDSTITVMKKITKVTYDTIAEELLMTSLVLDSKLNLDGKSKEIFDLPIIQDSNTRYYWIGWIGVGDDALAAYEKLQAEPPLSWQTKGVSIPLEAYGRGLTHSLPTGNSTVMLNAFYVQKSKGEAFLNQGSFIRYNAQGSLGNLPRLFRTEAAYFLKVLPISLCLENKERISRINIHVKVIGFRITKTEEETEIPVFESVKRTQKIEKK